MKKKYSLTLVGRFGSKDALGHHSPIDLNINWYNVLEFFDAPNCEATGSQMCLTVGSRPHNAYAVSTFTTFLEKPYAID